MSAVLLDEALAAWLESQDAEARVEVLAHAALLQAHGAALGRPFVDAVAGSMDPGMRELRFRVGAEPWRILFTVEPGGDIILLAGGSKAGDKRWYERTIALADERLARHRRNANRRPGRG